MTTINDKRKKINEFLEKANLDVPHAIHAPNTSKHAETDIAIIGISGFFPDCMSLDEFFDALDHDHPLLSKASEKRRTLKNYEGYAGLIPNIAGFDCDFFNYTPGEAARLDPQLRLLLMSVFNAIEDAGYAPSRLKKSATGVFIGCESADYIDLLDKAHEPLLTIYQRSQAMLANEISWFFDFHGSSETINAMCASGAVALHRAINALTLQQVNMAVVGAANIMLLPETFSDLKGCNQLSKHETVYSFGENADGYLRGEAVCALVLKPLSQAESDKDSIYAVIKNVTTNYNGQGGTSISSPDITAHCEVMHACYQQANLDIRDLDYIELQGMGHALTDLAEWEACNRTLIKLATQQGISASELTCKISTLKPMTGHLHAASALTALLKVIRSFKTNTIHKIIHFDKPYPALELKDMPCQLALQTEAFTPKANAHMAGIHSYGAGGVNAHILVKDYIQYPAKNRTDKNPYHFPFSAKNASSLQLLIKKYHAFLIQDETLNLADIAYTLQFGRDQMTSRLLIIANDKDHLLEQLNQYLNHDKPAPIAGSPGSLWMQGSTVDWAPLYKGNLPKRVHLPTYPFNLETDYWLEALDNIGDSGSKTPKSRSLPPLPHSPHALKQIISAVIADCLGQPHLKVDFQKEFSESGFNSLSVIHLSQKLSQQLHMDFDSSILFSVKTPQALLDRLCHPEPLHPKAPGQPHREIKDIAIIGIAGSFPKATDLEQLWENLCQGLDCTSQIPDDRWAVDTYFHPDIETARTTGRYYSRAGGFLERIDTFDPLFFHITPKEAEYMHPKERLFMQCAWHALEDACYPPEHLSQEQVGIFVGVSKAGLDNYKDSYFSIPNRISYHFNFTGPSIAIDTACSSSLTALHEACLHLQTGDCTFAIAGAVNLYTHPSTFIEFSRLKVMATEGHTRAFGDGATGFVPGEGVCALILKPLEQAIADHDSIYGVIIGSSINHGGKTNGYTVPNPDAHTALIQKALDRAQIASDQISYVEAHGTGTPLGDPIEIAGLRQAFQNSSPKAFQPPSDLQHQITGQEPLIRPAGTFSPSPGRREKGGSYLEATCKIGSIKSNIGHLEAAAGFAGVAKVLLQMQHNWIVPSLYAGIENPAISFTNSPFQVAKEGSQWFADSHQEKIACISSFGAGGSNGHVIIKHYIPPPTQPTVLETIIFVLSAKNRDRLMAYAERMRIFLNHYPDTSLPDFAYSLQTGRRPLPCRVAFTATSIQEVLLKLHSFLQQEQSDTYYFNEKTDTHHEVLALLDETLDFKRLFLQNLTRLDAQTIARFWISGIRIDWQAMYQQKQVMPNKISLPLYPFEAYALPAAPMVNSSAAPSIHAKKTSYSDTLHVENAFIASHVIQGQHVFPGVMYLSHVSQLLQSHISKNTPHTFPFMLTDIVWLTPMVFHENHLKIMTDVEQIDDKHVSFTVSTSHGTHCLGRFTKEMATTLNHVTADIHPASIIDSVSAEKCYHLFQQMGIDYGAPLQRIHHLDIAQDEQYKRYIIAKIKRSKAEVDSQPHYFLQPSLLDATFQALIGFTYDQKDPVPLLPFSLTEAAFFKSLPDDFTAILTQSDDQSFLDVMIQILSPAGELCAVLKGLASRKISQSLNKDRVHCYQSAWQPVSQSIVSNHSLASTRFHYIVGLPTLASYSTLHGQYIDFDFENPDIAWQHLLVILFEKIQTILRNHQDETYLLQIVIPAKEDGIPLDGLTGFLATATKEQPRLSTQLLLMSPDERVDGTLQKITFAQHHTHYTVLNFTLPQYSHKVWTPVSLPARQKPWKDYSTYLISGGLGGLAKLFIQDILASCQATTIYLLGRKAMDAELQQAMSSFDTGTHNIIHVKADITNEESLLSQEVDFHAVTGVLHLAGVYDDGYMINKKIDHFKKIGAPKITGTVNLDRLTAQSPLEFFVMFSSLASVTGQPGQSDYAAANGFLDNFAHYREQLVKQGKRSGKSLAINWSYWRNGGMRIPSKLLDVWQQQTGIQAIDEQQGLDVFYRLLHTTLPQYLIVAGNADKIDQYLNHLPGSRNLSTPVKTNESVHHIKAIIKTILSTITHLQDSRIEDTVSFGEYGLDSLLMTQMIMELEKYFGLLSKTLLFEYQTINALAGYFQTQFKDKFEQQLPAKPLLINDVKPDLERQDARNRPSGVGYDIAIIGLAGHYPQAPDLQCLWQNLQAGKDCITTIPVQRWDHGQFYDKRPKQKGKTYTKWGGFLENVYHFDPIFFGISPREAQIMTPQERLFLECAYTAIEDSGYKPGDLSQHPHFNKVGVFVGVMYEDYQLLALESGMKGNPFVVSNSFSAIANRVSYFCNFNGPSIAIDTMCSSSLTAIHLACQSLLSQESTVALAGGVNVTLHPAKYLMLGQGKFASLDGKCKSFGADGNGYVPSEGVGVVVLKPLAKAIADGDNIHGVIKSVAINHGGRSNGFTVPNPNTQAALIQEALHKAGIQPQDVDYIEAHGTGTELGDPIEIKSLDSAFGRITSKKIPIGSIKSNIGHCESAAGIAGLTKVLLQMQHQTLVPSIHAQTLNPTIHFEETPFYVQKQVSPWVKDKGPYIACVSSFGAGGSNAHLVVEAYPQPHLPVLSPRHEAYYPVILSANKSSQLLILVKELVESMDYHGYQDQHLPQIAYTLQTGRVHFKERLAFVVHSIAHLKTLIQNYLNRLADTSIIYGEQRAAFHEIEKNSFTLPHTNKTMICDLAKHWIAGHAIQWDVFYVDSKPKRCSLNTYPFDRKPYHIPNTEPTSPHAQIQLRTLDQYEEEAHGEERVHAEFNPVDLPLNAGVILSNENTSLAPASDIKKMLISSLAKELFMDEIDVKVDKDFIDMGLDSVIGLEWVAKINETFKTNLPTTTIYTHSTIDNLSNHLFEVLNTASTHHDQDLDNILQRIQNNQLDIHKAEALLDPLLQ